MPRSAYLIACLLSILSGCAVKTSAPQSAAPANKADDIAATSPIYPLLLAEFAVQRDQPDLAYRQYQLLAEKYRTPELAEQASYLAQYLGNAEDLSKSAQLWHDISPDSRVASNLLLDSLFQTKQYAEVFSTLNKFDWRSNNAMYSLLLGRVEQLDQGDIEAFSQALRPQLQQHPRNPFYHLSTALIARHQLRWQGAEDEVNEALHLAPSLQQAIVLKADLLFRQRKFTETTRFLSQANKAHPSPQLQDMLARAYLADNKAKKALPVLQSLIKEQPDNLEARFTLGRTQIQLARYKDAQNSFLELWDMAPNRSPVAFYLGYLAELQKDQDSAIDYYQQVTRGDELITAQSRLIVLLSGNGQDDQIPAMLKQARKNNPDQAAQLLELEAEWQSKKLDYAAARQAYDEALKLDPNNPQLLYNRAMLGDKDGNLEAMIADLEALVALEPDNAQILNALGYTLTDRTTRHNEALQLLLKAHTLQPDDPAILDSLGWVYYNLQRYDEAEDYLTKAYGAFPDPEVAYHYGAALWQQSKPDQALRIWRKALRSKPDYSPIRDIMEQYGVQP